MPTCFVMQPFDQGLFDKRYADVFEPAIKEAGLEPYRVDRDPGASIPIETIEDGIRSAEVCFAEISNDNPNVWFELGYAIAAGKDVVLICSDERKTAFPFDVQHRKIIKYKTDSPSDFAVLKTGIIDRIRALRETEKRIEALAEMPVLTTTEGLSDYEIVALVTIAKTADVPGGNVPASTIKRDCERAGYTGIAVTLGLRVLRRRGFVEVDTDSDDRGYESWPVFRATDAGLDWLEANQNRFVPATYGTGGRARRVILRVRHNTQMEPTRRTSLPSCRRGARLI